MEGNIINKTGKYHNKFISQKVEVAASGNKTEGIC